MSVDVRKSSAASDFNFGSLPFAKPGSPAAQSPVMKQRNRPTFRFAAESSGAVANTIAASLAAPCDASAAFTFCTSSFAAATSFGSLDLSAAVCVALANCAARL